MKDRIPAEFIEGVKEGRARYKMLRAAGKLTPDRVARETRNALKYLDYVAVQYRPGRVEFAKGRYLFWKGKC